MEIKIIKEDEVETIVNISHQLVINTIKGMAKNETVVINGLSIDGLTISVEKRDDLLFEINKQIDVLNNNIDGCGLGDEVINEFERRLQDFQRLRQVLMIYNDEKLIFV